MEKKNQYFKLFNTSLCFSLVSSIAILSGLFMGKNESVDKVLIIVFPAIFWIGLILEQVLFWMSNSLRKELLKQTKVRETSNSKIGLISFLQGKYGLIADVVLLISFIAFIVLTLTNNSNSVIQFITFFLLVLSFRLHCILNGKNFKYMTYIIKKDGKKDV